MQSVLDVADKPAKRGKKQETKKPKTKGPSSPKKEKSDKAAPLASKWKKVNKMAKRPKAPSPADSNNDEQSAKEDGDVHQEDSPREPLYQSLLLPFNHLFLLNQFQLLHFHLQFSLKKQQQQPLLLDLR